LEHSFVAIFSLHNSALVTGLTEDTSTITLSTNTRPFNYSDILIYAQQDARLHSLFYLETALHVSGGITTHYQERKQLYLQHLAFVTPLLLPVAIVAGSSNGVTNRAVSR